MTRPGPTSSPSSTSPPPPASARPCTTSWPAPPSRSSSPDRRRRRPHPDDVDRLLRAGADKVGVNTAAIARPEVISEIAERFGNQVLVLSADVASGAETESGWEVTTHGGRKRTGIDAVAWCARAAALGAGEILLNSIDADGTKAGFDLPLIAAVRAVVDIPVIASGGAGRAEHFPPAVDAGADAVLAASIFHFGEVAIGEVKNELAASGHPVRVPTA
ncbi:hypothetical protein GCM10029992_58100 [Glycomyces albus]